MNQSVTGVFKRENMQGHLLSALRNERKKAQQRERGKGRVQKDRPRPSEGKRHSLQRNERAFLSVPLS